MKRLFNFKYPKITAIIIISVLAYYIFSNPDVGYLVSHLGNLGYIGVFLGGMLFSFGFTTPIAIGFFVVLDPGNIFLAGILGGFGAMLSDLFIFSMIKMSFMDEFSRLKKTRSIMRIQELFARTMSQKIKLYLTYAFAGLVIASPLPDEIGVTMLAGLSKIRPFILSIISFVCNSLGILVLLFI